MYPCIKNLKSFIKRPICKQVLVWLIVSVGLFTCGLYAQNFTEIPTQILGVNIGSAAWGDFDNDLDLDLVVMGDSSNGFQYTARIYRNDDGNFVDINAPIVQAGGSGSVEWGDYDNDGDLDLLLTGKISATADITKIYQNENGSFSDIGGSLRALERGTASWGDYNNDGDLDFVICTADRQNSKLAARFKFFGLSMLVLEIPAAIEPGCYTDR